jgi:hypothetical protein
MQLSTATDQPSTQQSRLTGTVTDEDGEPLRGLYVKVVRGDTVVCWDETDCNGRYEVAVASGSYDVRFCSLAYHELVHPKMMVAGVCTNLDAVLVPII